MTHFFTVFTYIVLQIYNIRLNYEIKIYINIKLVNRHAQLIDETVNYLIIKN